MEVREKLVELIFKSLCRHIHKSCKLAENIADDLIADGVTVQEWISVKDRLPEEDVRVLVWVGENSCNFPLIDTDRIHNGRWVRWDKYISHWMPLPAPPKGE